MPPGSDAAGSRADRAPRTERSGTCPMGAGAVPLHEGGSGAVPWEDLRARHGGVVAVETAPGVSGWLVLGYKENLQVLRDQHYFSADPRPWGGTAPARGGALTRDGEEHQRLRAPLVEALARVGSARLVPAVEKAAGRLLDKVASQGRADLIGQYAAPLPALVLNDLFGLSDSYGWLLADLSARLWSGDPDLAEPAAHAVRAYFRGLVARKRREPGEDTASWLLRHPNGLTDQEAAEVLSLLWEIGHEPTTHLIGNALLRLLGDPAVWAGYIGGTLPPEDFLDYVMWTDPPLRLLAGRYSTTDIRFAGARISRGDPLLFGFAAAHTDPALGGRRLDADPLALAGDRSHLAWGAGAHRCPARGLARELVRTALDAVVDRLRGMILAVEPSQLRWRASLSVHGLAELPVWFTPTGERSEPEPQQDEPVRWIRRRRKKPRPQGARYQAPLAPSEDDSPQEAAPVPPAAGPAGKTAPAGARYQAPLAQPRHGKETPAGSRPPAPARRVAPAGARYQAPFAALREEKRPDPLEQLLDQWGRTD